jgi:hypothetical protein
MSTARSTLNVCPQHVQCRTWVYPQHVQRRTWVYPQYIQYSTPVCPRSWWWQWCRNMQCVWFVNTVVINALFICLDST